MARKPDYLIEMERRVKALEDVARLVKGICQPTPQPEATGYEGLGLYLRRRRVDDLMGIPDDDPGAIGSAADVVDADRIRDIVRESHADPVPLPCKCGAGVPVRMTTEDPALVCFKCSGCGESSLGWYTYSGALEDWNARHGQSPAQPPTPEPAPKPLAVVEIPAGRCTDDHADCPRYSRCDHCRLSGDRAVTCPFGPGPLTWTLTRGKP